jgi:hypothetical protein
MLFVDPGIDYHLYRQNPDGSWSHKPGHSPVKNEDESQPPKRILDPRNADRDERPAQALNYTQFCGCFSAPVGGIPVGT